MMVDISRECGLPVQLDDVNYSLIMDESLVENTPDIRKLEDLRPVLYEKEIQEPKELYSLFNDVGRPAARRFLHEHGLRYDLAIMPPLKMGAEYIKTIGHYHAISPGNNIPFAEVYEIVHGTAHFILQKQDAKDCKIVNDTIWIRAHKGDRLVMPPDYAHVTINPGPAGLVLSNLAAASGGHSYSRIVEMGGMAYYDIEYQGKPKLVKNPNYKNAPQVRSISLKSLRSFGVDPGQPIYLSATTEPQKFRFILEPQDYAELFDKITRKDKNKKEEEGHD